jgi:hypothetical protein
VPAQRTASYVSFQSRDRYLRLNSAYCWLGVLYGSCDTERNQSVITARTPKKRVSTVCREQPVGVFLSAHQDEFGCFLYEKCVLIGLISSGILFVVTDNSLLRKFLSFDNILHAGKVVAIGKHLLYNSWKWRYGFHWCFQLHLLQRLSRSMYVVLTRLQGNKFCASTQMFIEHLLSFGWTF